MGPLALPVGICAEGKAAVGTTLDTLRLGAQARTGQGARTSSASMPHTIVPGHEKEPGRLLLTVSSDRRQASCRPSHPSPSARATARLATLAHRSSCIRDSMSSPSLNPFSGNAEGPDLYHRPQSSDGLGHINYLEKAGHRRAPAPALPPASGYPLRAKFPRVISLLCTAGRRDCHALRAGSWRVPCRSPCEKPLGSLPNSKPAGRDKAPGAGAEKGLERNATPRPSLRQGPGRPCLALTAEVKPSNAELQSPWSNLGATTHRACVQAA